jgi:hypothetical protein
LGYVGKSSVEPWVKSLRGRLAELGWGDGQNFTTELREQGVSDSSTLVAELVSLPVDVLVTVGTPAQVTEWRS